MFWTNRCWESLYKALTFPVGSVPRLPFQQTWPSLIQRTSRTPNFRSWSRRRYEALHQEPVSCNKQNVTLLRSLRGLPLSPLCHLEQTKPYWNTNPLFYSFCWYISYIEITRNYTKLHILYIDDAVEWQTLEGRCVPLLVFQSNPLASWWCISFGGGKFDGKANGQWFLLGKPSGETWQWFWQIRWPSVQCTSLCKQQVQSVLQLVFQ